MSTIDVPADILELSPYGPTRSTITRNASQPRRIAQRPKCIGAPAII